MYDPAGFAVHLEPLAALRATDPGSVEAGALAGAEMGLADAIAIALPEPEADLQEKVPSW